MDDQGGERMRFLMVDVTSTDAVSYVNDMLANQIPEEILGVIG